MVIIEWTITLISILIFLMFSLVVIRPLMSVQTNNLNLGIRFNLKYSFNLGMGQSMIIIYLSGYFNRESSIRHELLYKFVINVGRNENIHNFIHNVFRQGAFYLLVFQYFYC